jgi:medium-chain acyl-[acyl-carrier-protein] hydrolase
VATLRVLRPPGDVSGRLVCFPCAGASAAFFGPWLPHLPEGVQPIAVDMPGHGSRMGAPLATDLSTIVDDVVAALAASDSLPTSFFGHSMGAVVAFEVARRMAPAGASPTVLFASSALPPHRLGRSRLHDLPDEAFVAALAEMDGMPGDVLVHPEVMDVMLPILRADITALERQPPSGHRIESPVVAMGGRHDRHLPPELLSGWRAHTRSTFEQHLFPGDHFYLLSRADLVARHVGRRALESFASSAA